MAFYYLYFIIIANLMPNLFYAYKRLKNICMTLIGDLFFLLCSVVLNISYSH